MDYLKMILTEEEAGHPSLGRRKNCWMEGMWTDTEENVEVLFFVLPEKVWKKSKLLRKTVMKIRNIPVEGKCLCWCGECVRKQIPDVVPVETEMLGWMHRLWEVQSSCAALVMILPNRKAEVDIRITERLIGDAYGRLNRLLIVGEEAESDYFSDIYGTTGLLAEFVSEKELRLLCTSLKKWGKTVWVDLRPRFRIPWHDMPCNGIYLDMTSQFEKERLLLTKRKDIHYISLWNFLDTYGRNSYNTYRCQKV